MYLAKTRKLAEMIAREKGLSYGLSVFDGQFYIGNREQLRSIGVADIRKGET